MFVTLHPFSVRVVSAQPAIDLIVAGPAYHDIVAAQGMDLVLAILTGQFVVLLGAPQHSPHGPPGTSLVV